MWNGGDIPYYSGPKCAFSYLELRVIRLLKIFTFTCLLSRYIYFGMVRFIAAQKQLDKAYNSGDKSQNSTRQKSIAGIAGHKSRTHWTETFIVSLCLTMHAMQCKLALLTCQDYFISYEVLTINLNTHATNHPLSFPPSPLWLKNKITQNG